MNRDWDIPDRVSVSIPADEEGFTGRECPQTDCQGYFKIEFGTGLKGENLPCHCPYCGNTADHDEFWTKEQIEYAKSIAVRQFSDAITRELKKMEFDFPARGNFGIGISMKVEPGLPHPVRYYREKRLETEIICDQCTLRYTIYGVFAHCPDCGVHNSPQILTKNLELAGKEIDLSNNVDNSELSVHLIADALENVVSAFDGFGREICRVNASMALNKEQAENLSFQNLTKANKHLERLFRIDIKKMCNAVEWELAVRCFNKRHLLAHKMGVVDQTYIDATQDHAAVVGHKISITPEEVRDLIKIIQRMGSALAFELSERGKTGNQGE